MRTRQRIITTCNKIHSTHRSMRFTRSCLDAQIVHLEPYFGSRSFNISCDVTNVLLVVILFHLRVAHLYFLFINAIINVPYCNIFQFLQWVIALIVSLFFCGRSTMPLRLLQREERNRKCMTRKDSSGE